MNHLSKSPSLQVSKSPSLQVSKSALLALLLLLASCNLMPTMTFNANGTPKMASLGCGLLDAADDETRTLKGNGWELTYHSKMREGTSVAKVGLGMWGMAKASQHNAATQQAKDANATKATINAQNQATQQAVNKSREAVTSQAIQANPAAVVPPTITAP